MTGGRCRPAPGMAYTYAWRQAFVPHCVVPAQCDVQFMAMLYVSTTAKYAWIVKSDAEYGINETNPWVLLAHHGFLCYYLTGVNS